MNELTPERERMLEECLQLLDRGASLDECLQRYPDDAEELRPYLELRASLLSEPLAEPPAGAYGAGRSRLLEGVAISREERAAKGLPWSLVTGLFTDQRLPGGGVVRAAAGVVAVLALGIGALGASAAGGFEPARDALEPARDILRTLHIVPDDDEPTKRESEQRPSDVDSDAVPTSEETREADRATVTQVPCDRGSDRPCEDEPRPSPTPVRDVRPKDEPIRDAAPTPAPLRDEPSRPSDREPTETPAQDSPLDEPPRDAEPTPETDSTDSPPRDAPPDDTRSGDAEPTTEPVAEPRPESDAPVLDEPNSRPADGLGSSAGDGRRGDHR
ncbi:MAG: hypothetical protein IH865_11100 [Chloroflexi bacterium]|nr:hypothetical protein [Chloroflexota bacterium]